MLRAGRLDKIMAIRKRHNPEQVVRKLMAADRLLAEGKDTSAVCRELGVSEATYHRWRNQFGGLKAEDAKRLKELERENSTLKRLLADAELEKAALKEIARGTSKPATSAGGRSISSAGAGGQRTVRLPRDRAASRHPTPRTDVGDPRGSRRRFAGVAAPIRQEPSAAGVSARVSRCPW
jgi:putative transposase